MPYKKGPNNTYRFYDSRTGRYASSFNIENFKPSKRKLSSIEIYELKRQILYNHAAKTKDKYVFELFKFIEENMPGTIVISNEKLYNKKIGNYREIDLSTKDFIIEVKSGKVRHNSSQFSAQKILAEEYNRKHIIYAPDITNRKYDELTKKGFEVYRNKNELLERIKK